MQIWNQISIEPSKMLYAPPPFTIHDTEKKNSERRLVLCQISINLGYSPSQADFLKVNKKLKTLLESQKFKEALTRKFTTQPITTKKAKREEEGEIVAEKLDRLEACGFAGKANIKDFLYCPPNSWGISLCKRFDRFWYSDRLKWIKLFSIINMQNSSFGYKI